MPRDSTLYSGFVLTDYILTFSIASQENREKLIELCRGPWQGDEIVPNTWEIANSLSPHDLETALVALLQDGDRAAYYYLSDSKRIYRVVLR